MRLRPNRQEPYTSGKENVLVASSVFVRCRPESGRKHRARHRHAWGGLRREEQGGAKAGRCQEEAAPRATRFGDAAAQEALEFRTNVHEILTT